VSERERERERQRERERELEIKRKRCYLRRPLVEEEEEKTFLASSKLR